MPDEEAEGFLGIRRGREGIEDLVPMDERGKEKGSLQPVVVGVPKVWEEPNEDQADQRVVTQLSGGQA